MVRAKFTCTGKSLTEYNGDQGFIINLIPVTSDNDENKDFFKWTPFGEIKMGTVNPAAAAEFEVGKEYYVDFTKAN